MTLTLTLFLALNIPPVLDGTPNRQPQLAAANGVVALVFGSGHSVMFAKSKDGGETFSKPIAVAEAPALALGRHRGPRVAFSGKTILVSAIAGMTPDDENLLVWRSTDGGASWSKGITVNDVAGAAREGLHAMAADESGHVASVWLDPRATGRNLQGKRLYGAFSNDAGVTWSKNSLVYDSPDGTICQCCHPTLSTMGNGEFAVMFRNFADGNRDMYLLRIRDGRVVSNAEELGLDHWTLNACPMDGGGMTVADGHIITAWRRGQDLFLAEPGQKETKIGSGIDIALASGRGTTYAVWTQAGVVESWVGGKVQVLGEHGEIPVVTALPAGGALAAWEEKGVIRMRRLK